MITGHYSKAATWLYKTSFHEVILLSTSFHIAPKIILVGFSIFILLSFTKKSLKVKAYSENLSFFLKKKLPFP